MKNKYKEKVNEAEVPSLNYDVIKDGVDPRMEALWEETRIQDEKVAQDMKEMEYESKLIADGFRQVTLSVNGEDPVTKWILKSDIPLKDNYILFCFDGDSEVFELIEDKDLPTYELF